MFFASVVILALFVALVIFMGTFTANELSYVLSLIAHHHVHIGYGWGILLNLVFNGVALTFDLSVAILRAAGAI